MKQITIQIPESNYTFFMELLKNLPFIKKVDNGNIEILDNLQQAIKEINAVKKGTLEARNARDLVNEL